MVALQILSKVLTAHSDALIKDNLLTADYFTGYSDEYNFILEHVERYGNVPDKETFLAEFPDFEIVEVTESDKYLIDKIREEYLYTRIVPVIQKSADLLKSDSNESAEYLLTQLKQLRPNYGIGGTDIVADAESRYEQYVDRKNNQDNWFFTTGFEELDDVIHGLQRGEELVVIVARTNQGKSWIAEKMCTHVWQLGFNVGYISPEMSANSIGYRFDTLYRNYSNKGLTWGKSEVNESAYKEYLGGLKNNTNKFMVATPVDFDRKITVTRIRQWVQQYELKLVVIDGITYIQDERYRRGDSKTTSLTNISEDLMSLSVEMGIPIIVVVQANRGAVSDEKKNTPELENIRDSDGIAFNASKVISIRQMADSVLKLEIKKQRFGRVGGTLCYNWSIDTGEFDFIPSYDDAESASTTKQKVERLKKKYNDVEDVF